MKKAMKRGLSMLFVVALVASMLAIPVSAVLYWETAPIASKTAYIMTHTLKTGGKIPVYTDKALTKRATTKDGVQRYIARDNDPCKIIEMSAMDAKYNSIRVIYILSSGGTYDGWVDASEFVNNGKRFNDWYKMAYPPVNATKYYPVYMRSNGDTEIGSIFRKTKNDKNYVLILEGTEQGKYVQVIYRVTDGNEKGNYKMGWMKQSVVAKFLPDP